MECSQTQNLQQCSCSYEPSPRKGIRCECIAYYRGCGELPGGLFPPEVESTYHRSIARFVNLHSQGQ